MLESKADENPIVNSLKVGPAFDTGITMDCLRL